MPFSGHFWKSRCSKSKCTKHISSLKKCTHLCREAHFQVKMVRAPLLDVQMSFRVAGARDCAPCLKWAKREGFVAFQNTMAGGTFEGNLQRCILRVRRSTKDTWVRHVRRSGRWFPDRGFILEHQIFRFAEVVLRDRCSTSYDLSSLFRGTIEWKNRKTRHSTFHFWRKSHCIASFLMLSSSKIEEAWQNFIALALGTYNSWASLAEFLGFGTVHSHFLRKSRRIASFHRERQRQTDRQTERERERGSTTIIIFSPTKIAMWGVYPMFSRLISLELCGNCHRIMNIL